MYYIILCEIATGIILELDGKTRFLKTETNSQPYITFENLKEAEDKANIFVLENQDLEIAIYDHAWELKKRVTKEK